MSLYLKDIKKGQVFYEYQGRHHIVWTALDDAVITDEGAMVQAKNRHGHTKELFTRHGFEHYLKFYDKPAYVGTTEL